MTRRIFVALAFAVLLGSLVGVRATPSLVALTDRVLVTPDHRVSEFTVASDPADPNRVMMGTIDWDDPTGGVGCGIWSSADGGRTWARGRPIPGLDEPFARADPWVSYAPNGDAHMTCLQVAGPPTGSLTPDALGQPKTADVVHAVLRNGKTTWDQATPVPAQTPTNSRDKESIIVTRSGRIVICSTDAPKPVNSLVIYSSDNDGVTWNTPIVVDGPDGKPMLGGNCNGIVEGPAGTLHAIGYGFDPFDPNALDIDVVTSHDDGRHWDGAVVVDRLYFPSDVTWTAQAVLIYPKGQWPSIAVNPITGHVAVAAMYWDTPRDRFWSTLYLSTDGGAHFSNIGAPVPPETGCSGCHLSSPLVAYDSQGRLGFESTLYSNDGGLTKQTWLQVSPDGDALSWLAPIMVGGASGPLQAWTNPLTWTPKDPNAQATEEEFLIDHPTAIGGEATDWAARAEGGPTTHLRLGGDYWGMVATPEGFLCMWNDHSNGYPQVWARLVAVTP